MNQLYEWVVSCDDEEFILTEKQHEYLIKNQDKRFVAFPGFTIQPAMVAWMKRRPAEALKQMYPCKKCYSSGVFIEQSGEVQPNGSMPTTEMICPDCGGTGVNLP